MSQFVSGGTNDAPTERDEEWLKAQQEIEARRREKARIGVQNEGKSLYETLQANKAAKQDAFEESIRLKNQFRSLDEDEAEFLDSVLESTRAKEAEVKKQTRQELDSFRRQQEEAEKAAKAALAPESADTLETTNWSVSRKRKKGREDALGGIKLRKSSTGENVSSGTQPAYAPSSPPKPGEDARNSPPAKESSSKTKPLGNVDPAVAAKTPDSRPKAAAPSLGLVAYSSDEDD